MGIINIVADISAILCGEGERDGCGQFYWNIFRF
jgi:hypothetical protein